MLGTSGASVFITPMERECGRQTHPTALQQHQQQAKTCAHAHSQQSNGFICSVPSPCLWPLLADSQKGPPCLHCRHFGLPPTRSVAPVTPSATALVPMHPLKPRNITQCPPTHSFPHVMPCHLFPLYPHAAHPFSLTTDPTLLPAPSRLLPSAGRPVSDPVCSRSRRRDGESVTSRLLHGLLGLLRVGARLRHERHSDGLLELGHGVCRHHQQRLHVARHLLDLQVAPPVVGADCGGGGEAGTRAGAARPGEVAGLERRRARAGPWIGE